VGLNPGVTRYVVVRARDAAGNSLASTVEKSGTTLAATADTKAPTFNSAISVAVPDDGSPYGLSVSWSAATDDSPAAGIRYHVCAETVELNCAGAEFAKHIHAVTAPGVTSIDLTGLISRTHYFVYVRAEDAGGNLDAGNHGAAATTLTSWSQDVQPLLQTKCGGCHLSYFGSPGNIVQAESSFTDPKVGTEPGIVLSCSGPNNTTCVPKPGQVSKIKIVRKPQGQPGDPALSSLYRRINPLGSTLAPFSAAIPNNYAGTQEPRDGANLSFTPLSPQEDGAIRDWITQGAYSF